MRLKTAEKRTMHQLRMEKGKTKRKLKKTPGKMQSRKIFEL